jgi:hypothetical protein
MLRDRLRLATLVATALLLTACAGGESAKIAPDHQPASVIPDGPMTSKSLLGVAPTALAARLGKPDFRRSEPIGAEVWQYAGSGCNLFVYFYRNASGALDSTYVDARKRKGGDASTQDCLEQVQRQRAIAPVS